MSAPRLYDPGSYPQLGATDTYLIKELDSIAQAIARLNLITSTVTTLAANDAAAAAANVPIGSLYRTAAGVVHVRLV